jgi:ubiquinone/menaquinone biosynthesis C-methylase UbiE
MQQSSDQIEQTNYSLQNPLIKMLLANFIDKINALLVSIHASNKKGLDAGCGEGHLLCRLHDRGTLGDLIAVDLNADYLAYASKKQPHPDYSVASLDHLPFSDQTFDYILSTEVFEHLYEPDRALAELQRVAKKGANLIISVPFEPFFHWGNLARGKYWDRGGYTPDHRNLWRRRQFKQFLAPVVHIEREYTFRSFPWMLYRCRFK